MPYRASIIENVFVVRWDAPPTVADVGALAETLRHEHAARGVKLGVVSVIFPTAELPDRHAQQALRAALPAILEHVEMLFSVVQAKGPAGTLLRTFLRGITIVTSLHGRTAVAATLEEALRELRKKMAFDPAAVLAGARKANLV